MDYYDDKKAPLLPKDQDTGAIIASKTKKPVKDKKRIIVFGVFLAVCLVLISAKSIIHLARRHVRRCNHATFNNAAPTCPQTTALVPKASIATELSDLYHTGDFKQKAVEWLSGAVQVKTESFDKMGPVGEDPRWEAFGPFHDYLEKAFPKIHDTLQLRKVNTYGLLYHWQGSDESLKPILLMGHQDVVPVEPLTWDQWIHPPYSGHYDGKWIWGRGSGDDKSGVIGIMAALESLIAGGFTPKRTIILSFGFDEEASGVQGAQALATEILKTYGENSIAFLVDEGGGYGERDGTTFAVPAVGEKGYLDTRITVSSPGGHSSVPPEHTSIGILSRLLVEYENNPIPAHLGRSTATYRTILCLGEHSTDFPKSLKRLIRKSVKSDKALRKVEEALFKDRGFKAQAGTTQAVDLINGGVKVNALPETADAVVNHRIASDSSVRAVMDRDTALLVPLATHFNLSLTAYGEKIATVDGPTYGSIELNDAWGTALEPAPITPTDPDSEPYKLLSGTIIATYEASEDFRKSDGKSLVVAPGSSTGNTDTRYYWKVTSHIFRYNHRAASGSYNGAHTVNEAVTADSFLEVIKFFTTLVLNADESSSL